jgi:hypothetical protein
MFKKLNEAKICPGILNNPEKHRDRMEKLLLTMESLRMVSGGLTSIMRFNFQLFKSFIHIDYFDSQM